MDHESADSDGDGLSDALELGPDPQQPRDTDQDGTIDALDEDDDGDGELTLDEMADPNSDGDPADARDSNNDQIPDYLDKDSNYNSRDDDGDGLPNGLEKQLNTNPTLTDSDGDGLTDRFEIGEDTDNPVDTDDDGVINALDPDDDDDGIMTAMENPDPNDDGDPADAEDSNNNGKPDYLDTDNVPDELPDADKAAEEDKDAAKTDDAQEETKPADTEKETAEDKADAKDAKNVDGKDDDKVTVDADQNEGGKGVRSARLYFPFRSAEPELADSAAEYFDLVIKQLKDNPDIKIRLVGHTDSVGRAAANERLGRERAEEVRDMLVKRGAPRKQIEVDSKGETEPVADNKTEEGRKKNRRVELQAID
ncbi:MAG: OmpA family protein [Thiolinea sp.]